jgi:mono/diheme cytochrome c family protein
MRKLIQFVAAMALTVAGVTAVAADSRVARGEYLVRFGSCNDCHTPGYFLGKPDSSRFLGGSDVGFDLPGLGTFVGPNLTPDDKTGLGTWSKDQIIAAIQTGVRPDGRILAPIMPWRAFAGLTKSDAGAIADYLKKFATGQPQDTRAVWIRRQAAGASNDGGLSGRQQLAAGCFVAGERVERRRAAILAVDAAGYSRLMGVDESGALAALKAHRREILDPAIASHHGRIVVALQA